MLLFLPTVAIEKVTDITPQLVRKMKAKALIVDADNTMAVHNSPEPLEGTVEWVKEMQRSGIRVVMMSNNFKKRVADLADRYKIPYIALSLKPLPVSYLRATRKLGVKHREAIVVGDQIMTDIFGANLSLMKSILLVPTGKENSRSFDVRRKFEKPFRKLTEITGRGKKYKKYLKK